MSSSDVGRVVAFGMVASLLALAGCASGPTPPNQQLAATEAALEDAGSADARRAAPALLDSARENLGGARQLINQASYSDARRLLEVAEADARLAQAKGEAAASRRVLAEVRQEIGALEQQLASGQP